ncbi:MAG: formate/nitrite transporter family protein [Rhodanobacteraceae bacterium]
MTSSASKKKKDAIGDHGLSAKENRKVEDQTSIPSPVVYHTVRAEGEVELARPAQSLWWSGLVAGIAISSSVFMQGILHGYLPNAPWSAAVASLGYCTGFLIVVLGRMQLFTETTITAVLPLLVERTWRALMSTLRLWGIVFVANLAGTALASIMAIYARVATPEQLAGFYAVAQTLASKTPLNVLLQGVPAGFFIAAMVWMLAASKEGRFWIIALMSYIIALGGSTHVVVGSTEVFLLMFSGQLAPLHGIFGVLVPALVGNMVGGTGLFALLAYGQVKEEI